MNAERKLKQLRKIVNQQAEDKALWFDADYASEAYLQQELRKLHVAIEGKTQEECVKEMESFENNIKKR